MNPTMMNLLAGLILGSITSWNASGQALTPPTRTPPIVTDRGGGGGGGGYASGGERGSVVRVMSYREVQSELSLTDDQINQITGILSRVQAQEEALFEDFQRVRTQQRNRHQTQFEQRMRHQQRAQQTLAKATQAILRELSPAQRTQLQRLCRQAAVGKPPLQTGSPRGYVGGGGGSGGGVQGGLSGSNRVELRSEYTSGGGPGGVVGVIAVPTVQDQLALTSEQRQKIAQITAEVANAEAELFRSPASRPRGLAIEWDEHQKKADAMRQEVIRAGEEIRACLTGSQKERLNEICLQAQGADALLKPEVVRALGLSPTQQLKLASQRQEAERQIEGLVSARSAGVANTNERLNQLRRDTEQKMLTTVLTPAQQAKFRQMRGKDFAGLSQFSDPYASGGGGGSSSTSHTQSLP